MYTSVGSTQVVTTVCDGPDTRILTIYPTSRFTSVITIAALEYATTTSRPSIHIGATYPAYPMPSAGYSEAASPSHSLAYLSQYSEYVSSAYEHLQSEYSVASPYPSAAGYSEVPSASYGYDYATVSAIETIKYDATLPLPPLSAPTVVVVTEQAASSEYPLNPGSPSASPYVYSNATTSYSVGNSTATATGPVLYTGGARAHVVRDVVGGVAGAVVAVMGLGIL